MMAILERDDNRIEGDELRQNLDCGHFRRHQALLPTIPCGMPMKARNSRRVEGSLRKAPSMRLVTIEVPGLCTPRVVMH